MNFPLLKHLVLFANSNGENLHSQGFLKLFAGQADSDLTVVGLAEELPSVSPFSSDTRRKRLEELVSSAANRSVDEAVALAKSAGFSDVDQKILRGRFPVALTDFLDSTPATLLIKDSLPCDGRFGNASKGDVKLTRESPAPVLLAHSPVFSGRSVLVGIPAAESDTSLDRVSISLVETAASFARLFDSELCIVHAWDLWGVGLLRNRVPASEIEAELVALKKGADKAVERVLAQSELEGVRHETIIGRGNPTRVLSGAIDVKMPGLIVLGSNAREGIQGAILGNTAETIVRTIPSSVLVIR